MATANADALRRAWAAWNDGDPSVAASLLAPDFVYVDTFVPDSVAETYHGPEGLLTAWRRWCEPWEGITTDVEHVLGEGDRLVSVHRQRARAKGSGVPVELRYAYVVEFRDGRITRLQSYLDPDEALRTVGLDEGDARRR